MTDVIRGWVKPRVAAKYADVSEEKIREWMRSGLPFSAVSDRISLIRISDIDKFLDSRLQTRNDLEDKVNDTVDSILNSLKGGKKCGRNRS